MKMGGRHVCPVPLFCGWHLSTDPARLDHAGAQKGMAHLHHPCQTQRSQQSLPCVTYILEHVRSCPGRQVPGRKAISLGWGGPCSSPPLSPRPHLLSAVSVPGRLRPPGLTCPASLPHGRGSWSPAPAAGCASPLSGGAQGGRCSLGEGTD